jgi:hypothetical protein
MPDDVLSLIGADGPPDQATRAAALAAALRKERLAAALTNTLGAGMGGGLEAAGKSMADASNFNNELQQKALVTGSEQLLGRQQKERDLQENISSRKANLHEQLLARHQDWLLRTQGLTEQRLARQQQGDQYKQDRLNQGRERIDNGLAKEDERAMEHVTAVGQKSNASTAAAVAAGHIKITPEGIPGTGYWETLGLNSGIPGIPGLTRLIGGPDVASNNAALTELAKSILLEKGGNINHDAQELQRIGLGIAPGMPPEVTRQKIADGLTELTQILRNREAGFGNFKAPGALHGKSYIDEYHAKGGITSADVEKIALQIRGGSGEGNGGFDPQNQPHAPAPITPDELSKYYAE